MKQDLAHMIEFALQDNPNLSSLRPVVEKEILYCDILHGLLKGASRNSSSPTALPGSCRGSWTS